MKNVIVCVSMCLLLIASSLLAEAKGPEDRIAALEKQLADLQRTYLNNNQEVASTISRTQAVQEDFNSVKGQIEANTHALKTQYEELTRQLSELEHRIQAIEERMGVYTNQLSNALSKVNPAAGAEADLYQKSLDLANESKYLEAAAGFETFLQKHSKSQFAPNARFWIGDCFYNMRDYKRAVKEFQNYIEKSPGDSKIPEAIFKQGNSFYEIGMMEEAKAFYEKIATAYPNSQYASQAKTKLDRINNKQGTAKALSTSSGGSSSYPSQTIEQQRNNARGVETNTKYQSTPDKKKSTSPKGF